MLRGLSAAVEPASITAIVNTGDDSIMHGLQISPDLDTVTYTLAEAIDPERGWGLVGESWRTMEALARYTPARPEGSRAGGTWFNLGDRDLATHLYRTGRLTEGATLGTVTAEIVSSWGLTQRILPMTDDPVRTRVLVDDGWIDFQEYFVGRRHSVAVREVRFDGVSEARVTPAALEALRAEDVLIAPSNPIVSIGPILALAGVREVLAERRERVVGVSPIVAGAALKGPADRMLTELGHEASVVGVARLYEPICGTLVIDEQDADRVSEIEDCGIRCVVTDTIMKTPAIARALALTALESIR
jgi:LPPG:FO 2-phospho-L-lactate transferase